MEFEYRSYPNKVIFGTRLFDRFLDELSEYKKIMVFAGDRMQPQIDLVRKRFGEENVYLFSNIIQHVPQTLVDEASTFLKNNPADLLLPIGGGSAIGLAKALALHSDIPIAAVPTTYSGSEQTNIWGISSESGKTTGKSDNVLPKFVLYDPIFTQSLPPQLAVKSAMNAMAHLMEAVYAPDGNPITRHNALLGITSLKSGLTVLGESKELTREANESIIFGAYLAGKSLCEVSMSLHHKTAHVMGGSFGMDHASVHTVLQSYVLQYQWPYLSKEVREDFIESLGKNPPLQLKNLAEKGGVATDLKSIGFSESDIPKAVKIILSKPYANVAPLEETELLQMLKNAFFGKIDDNNR